MIKKEIKKKTQSEKLEKKEEQIYKGTFTT